MKGIIFDLDGTLVDSIADLGNSVNKVLEQRRLQQFPLEQYKKFLGNGVHKLVERSLPADYPEAQEAFDEFYEIYKNNCLVETKPFDGIVEMLVELNALNVPIALCTNKEETLSYQIMEGCFPNIDFISIIGDRYDGLKKPNAHYPLEIANVMGLKPEDILFVGDTNVDIETAINAEMIPVGVSWGFRTNEELEIAGAKYIIDEPAELIQILRSL